jgi:hypothetical protein
MPLQDVIAGAMRQIGKEDRPCGARPWYRAHHVDLTQISVTHVAFSVTFTSGYDT